MTYPSTSPTPPERDQPRQGHDFDLSLNETQSYAGYIPGARQSWRVIDETIGIDEHADSARESALPPRDRLGEDNYGQPAGPRQPDRYIDSQAAHSDPYSTVHPGQKPLA